MLFRYFVKAVDDYGNITILSEHYNHSDALEDEKIFKINNPTHRVWVDSVFVKEG